MVRCHCACFAGENDVKVGGIFDNRWVAKKAELSNSKTVRATIWGQLQARTMDHCEYVGVVKRHPPQVFLKDEKSHWTIDMTEARDLVPELFEKLDSVNNFKPASDKKYKRYRFTTFHQSFGYEDFIEGIKPKKWKKMNNKS